MIEKQNPWRSPAHRQNVASLACVACGIEGSTQAAHRNEGKGMAIKACDSQMMALCANCHSAIDKGGQLTRDIRRELEKYYVRITREKLIRADKWSFDADIAYHRVKS